MSDIKDRNDCRYDLQIRGERIKAVCTGGFQQFEAAGTLI